MSGRQTRSGKPSAKATEPGTSKGKKSAGRANPTHQGLKR
jgi:hypothetical protein